jgi:hypothetical protein
MQDNGRSHAWLARRRASITVAETRRLSAFYLAITCRLRLGSYLSPYAEPRSAIRDLVGREPTVA